MKTKKQRKLKVEFVNLRAINNSISPRFINRVQVGSSLLKTVEDSGNYYTVKQWSEWVKQG